MFIDIDWTGRACEGLDVNLFFPEPGYGRAKDYTEAKQVCRECPIIHDCLLYATQPGDPTNGEGVWGGCSPRERETFRSARNKQIRNQEAS